MKTYYMTKVSRNKKGTTHGYYRERERLFEPVIRRSSTSAIPEQCSTGGDMSIWTCEAEIPMSGFFFCGLGFSS
jgi:hypothetical protein